MPTSSAELNSGLAIFGAMAFVAVTASLLTMVASAVLLAAYRRRVGAIMAAKGAGSVAASRPDAPAEAPRKAGRTQAVDFAAALHRRGVEEPWRLSLRYALAGTGFALFMASVYALAVFQPQPNFGSFFHPYRFLYLMWTFVWPVVLAATIVSASSWRTRGGLIAAYFLVLVALGALVTMTQTQAPRQWGDVTFPGWATATPTLTVAQWTVLNALPTAAILGFRHRRVRAVGPLVLAFMTVITTGVAGLLLVLFAKGTSEPVLKLLAPVTGTFSIPVAWTVGAYFLVPTLLCCAVFAGFGWLLLLWIRRGYGRKRISDQSLFLDAVWLTFGFTYATALAVFGPGWAAVGLPAFLIYKGGIRLANRRSGASRGGPGCRLLVLRVFALGRRTEALFDRVIARWRYVGSVQLIAGTDLAGATVAPHLFLSFLGGRLAASFIADQATLDLAIRRLDTARDADGRFRVNDFFCYADTWQPVLTRLIGASEVVLMDLRQFGEGNAGCELNRLTEVAPVAQVVLIVDATTDLAFLRRTLEDAWRKMPADAPNRELAPAAIEMVWLPSLSRSDLNRLHRRLCHAAAAMSREQARAPANGVA